MAGRRLGAAVLAALAVGVAFLIWDGGTSPENSGRTGAAPRGPLASLPDSGLSDDAGMTDRCTAFFEVLWSRQNHDIGEVVLRRLRNAPDPFPFLNEIPGRYRLGDTSRPRLMEMILAYEETFRGHLHEIPEHPVFLADEAACLAWFEARDDR